MAALNNILLIDDDKINTVVYERIINLSGFAKKVHSCTSVDDAKIILQKAAELNTFIPSVILLDFHLGHQNGCDFMIWYSEWSKSTVFSPPIYILSSYLNDDIVKNCSEYPQIHGFISKPLKIEDLNNIKLDFLQKFVVS